MMEINPKFYPMMDPKTRKYEWEHMNKPKKAKMALEGTAFTVFTEDDWMGFADARNFRCGSSPIICELVGKEGKQTLLVSSEGIELYNEDSEECIAQIAFHEKANLFLYDVVVLMQSIYKAFIPCPERDEKREKDKQFKEWVLWNQIYPETKDSNKRDYTLEHMRQMWDAIGQPEAPNYPNKKPRKVIKERI